MDRTQGFEDLILDESFIKWVKNPDYELNLYWEQWIKHNQHRRDDVILAKEVILRVKFKTASPDEETTKRVFNQIIGNSRGVDTKKSKKNSKLHTYNSFYYLRVAAVFLILLISAGGIYFVVQQNREYLLQQSQIKYITKSNPSSVRSKIKLPDGTKVWLNAASEITYPDRFGAMREVRLKGEAYFEVVHNVNAPFIVQTISSQVKVLGTSFNVKAYDNDKIDQISLVTGKVEISKADLNSNVAGAVVLRPGEQLVVDKETGSITTGLFDKKNVIGWTEGYLSFKDATKEEIISKLERWYDVKINVINEPDEQWDVNGHFRNQSLELVLDRLSFSKEFSYTMNGKNVTIKFK